MVRTVLSSEVAMFKVLRKFQEINPKAFDRFVKLTDSLEAAGMFKSSLSFDFSPGGIVFSTRRGEWEFHWGFRFLGPGDSPGHIEVFLGKPGSLLILRDMFEVGDPREEVIHHGCTQDEIPTTPQAFRSLRDKVYETAGTPEGWLQKALFMAEYFQKLQT